MMIITILKLLIKGIIPVAHIQNFVCLVSECAHMHEYDKLRTFLSDNKIHDKFICHAVGNSTCLKCFYLLAAALEPHENRRHTALTVHQPHLLTQLRELKQTLLVQLYALLEDAQQHL
jgi:hypothetical protein